MAIKIIAGECVNCHACLPECPNNAIYEPGEKWKWSDGTSLTSVELSDGTIVDANEMQETIDDAFYFIVPGKCTECTGFHEEPACAMVCPVDCCVPDPDYEETKEELVLKKQWLHNEIATSF